MKNEHKLYDLLVRSFDTPLAKEEQEQLEFALKNSEVLRKAQQELIGLRSQLSSFEVSAEPLFTDQVMQKIGASSTKIIPLRRYATQIAAACLILILATGVGMYMLEGGLDAEIILGVDELDPLDAYTLLNQ